MEDSLALIWKHIAEHIRTQVSASIFQRWFEKIRLTGADETQLVLCVPDQIFQLWIESNYLSCVQGAVVKVLGSQREIHFRIDSGKPSVTPDLFHKAELASEKSSSEADVLITETPASAPERVSTGTGGSKNDASPNSGMNPRFTFGTFVVGENSRYAHAAALAVAQSPAKTYNPLFIHGGVGLGKTHLMQAIGQHVAAKKKGMKVVYVSSERFTNEFIDAIQHSTLGKFRKKYRWADVLLIDDIQFLAGRERTQEEFFHTFNTLMDGHKQIILSSDRPPAEISNLEQRLVSRFEWGMTTTLEPPDVETRVAILRKKAEIMQIRIDDKIIEFLAQRIRSNIRRLEGALVRVAGYASLCGGKLTTEEVEVRLRDIFQEESRRAVTIDQIQKRVAEHFDVRIADMTSKRRPANIAFPRQIAMYLARELTRSSLSEIGDAFGGRDHGTVLHAHKLVRGRIDKEEKIRQVVAFLDTQLNR